MYSFYTSAFRSTSRAKKRGKVAKIVQFHYESITRLFVLLKDLETFLRFLFSGGLRETWNML